MERRSHLLVSAIFGASVVLAVVALTMGTGGRAPSGRTPVAAPVTATTGHRAAPVSVPGNRFPPLLATTTSPLRILEIGDSLGIDLGDQLQTEFDGPGTATMTMASMGDSGLSNAAFYDWPTELAGLLTADHPQIVVVFLGANDDQGLLVDGTAAAPGTAAWKADYAQRVDEILREATGTGARVVWVGMPPMENADLNAAMEVENTIFKDQTEGFPGILYVSSFSVLGTASGLYQSSGVDPSGQPDILRTSDGVHLTPDGARLLASAVIGAIDTRWHLSFNHEQPCC